MKFWLAVPLATGLILSFCFTPVMTAERACRPSLSNFYHCPDNNTASPAPSSRATNATKKCVPSVSNFWTCPDGSKPRTTASTRTCRPSLSNGYHCPGTTSASPGSSAKRPRQIVKCLSVSDDRPIQLLRGSAHVDRACRMGINAPAPLLPQQSPLEKDNTRPKRKQGCIARVTLSFGQIRILTSTISPELGTTAPQ